MIVSKRTAEELTAGGYALVHQDHVPHYEAFGVPLCMSFVPGTGETSGPWAPR